MAAMRKTHSPEFKTKPVVETLKDQRTVLEIAAELDLNQNLLFKWHKEFLDHLDHESEAESIPIPLTPFMSHILPTASSAPWGLA